MIYEIRIPAEEKRALVIKTFDDPHEALAWCWHRWTAKSGIDMVDDRGIAELVTMSPYGCWSVTIPICDRHVADVEGFKHKSDAIDFARSNYGADDRGRIPLIYAVSVKPLHNQNKE